jgi:hypothetical protein
MDAVRKAWTDERLDDLNRGMHREFDQVHTEIRVVRTDLGGEIQAVRSDLGYEIRSLRTAIIVGAGSVIASVLGSAAAAILSHAL